MENLIFSDFKAKLKKNISEYQDHLFVVRFQDVTTYSSEFADIISGPRYHIPVDWHNLCFDICSEFVVPRSRGKVENLYRQNESKCNKYVLCQNATSMIL